MAGECFSRKGLIERIELLLDRIDSSDFEHDVLNECLEMLPVEYLREIWQKCREQAGRKDRATRRLAKKKK